MAIDVSSLNIYKDELSFGLAKKAVLEQDDIKYFDVRTDVVGSIQLNTLSSTMNGTNDNCSFADSGTTKFSGNILTPVDINFYEDLCAKSAQAYWMGKFNSATDMGESFGSLEEIVMDEKMGVIGATLESIRWRGVATGEATPYASVTGNLTLGSGVLQAAHKLSATTVNVTRVAMTVSNAIATIDAYADAIPAAIESKEDLRCFLSPSDFRIYMKALRNANYFQVDTNSKGVIEIAHPGEIALMVTKVNGLVGAPSGTAIITHKANLVLGTLVSPEAMDASLWFSRDERKVKFASEQAMGIQLVHAEEVVAAIV